ncbi:MAG: dicarboxylate/amino acid:cation symporter [Magnetococcales bacterium]|nr:dicarboxylate/amino acid:cation symporter [Magnetococcales bacterium]
MQLLARFAHYLLSPWLIMAGIGAGGYIGVYHHDFAKEISIYGDAYLNLLKMCVIPILITSITFSLGNMLQMGVSGKFIKYIIVVFLGCLLLSSTVGLVAGVVFEPGLKLDKTTKDTMGKEILHSEMSSDSQDTPTTKEKSEAGLSGFLLKMIPSNVFVSIIEGRNLSILVFVVFFGIALGLLRQSSARVALDVMNAFYESMLTIIQWTMYALPFGLMCLVASQISQVGTEILTATIKLVVLVYLASLFLVIIFFVLIKIYSRKGLWQTISALREPLLIGFGSGSSFTAVPSALMQLKNKLDCDRNNADLILPLGIALNPAGSVLHFSITAVFIAQLYGVSALNNWSVILIGSVLAGIAASGAPGLAALSMIAIVTDPLELPTGVAITLLAAIDPIIDPILTLVTVHANCTAPVIVSAATRKTNAESTDHQPVA